MNKAFCLRFVVAAQNGCDVELLPFTKDEPGISFTIPNQVTRFRFPNVQGGDSRLCVNSSSAFWWSYKLDRHTPLTEAQKQLIAKAMAQLLGMSPTTAFGRNCSLYEHSLAMQACAVRRHSAAAGGPLAQ